MLRCSRVAKSTNRSTRALRQHMKSEFCRFALISAFAQFQTVSRVTFAPLACRTSGVYLLSEMVQLGEAEMRAVDGCDEWNNPSNDHVLRIKDVRGRAPSIEQG